MCASGGFVPRVAVVAHSRRKVGHEGGQKKKIRNARKDAGTWRVTWA